MLVVPSYWTQWTQTPELFMKMKWIQFIKLQRCVGRLDSIHMSVLYSDFFRLSHMHACRSFNSLRSLNCLHACLQDYFSSVYSCFLFSRSCTRDIVSSALLGHVYSLHQLPTILLLVYISRPTNKYIGLTVPGDRNQEVVKL